MDNRGPRNRKTRDTIIRYMMSFANEQGRQPSVREIGEDLRRMVNEGLLTQGEQSRRNYFVTQTAVLLLRQAG